MDLLNIAASLIAIAGITGLLHLAARAGERKERKSELASSALALTFVMLFVGAIGWVFQAVLPTSSSAPVSLGITAGLCVVVVGVTYFALNRRRGPTPAE
jgi:cbb3-type cytochrome oxidase subunit 3